MLFVLSVLKGFTVAASDGKIGTVDDFLFDDQSWRLRWLVVDTGAWLPGRKVLVHASAIGEPDPARQELPVKLTKAQVEGGPDFSSTSRSRARWRRIFTIITAGIRPGAAATFGAIASPFSLPPLIGEPPEPAERRGAAEGESDPHLRSAAGTRGLSHRGERWRDRPSRKPCRRSRQLGYPLSRRRHQQLVGRQACPDRALAVKGSTGPTATSASTSRANRSSPARPAIRSTWSTRPMSGCCTAIMAGPAIGIIRTRRAPSLSTRSRRVAAAAAGLRGGSFSHSTHVDSARLCCGAEEIVAQMSHPATL